MYISGKAGLAGGISWQQNIPVWQREAGLGAAAGNSGTFIDQILKTMLGNLWNEAWQSRYNITVGMKIQEP